MREPRKTIPEEIQRRITKFFVTKIPERCSGSDLANVLRGHGIIYDIYIAKKRDKGGNRFGFFSFLDVKDKVETTRNMKDLRLGEHKLLVNVARYVLEDGEIRDPPPRVFPKPSKPVNPQPGGVSNNRYEKVGSFSFREALTGERSSKGIDAKVLKFGDRPSTISDFSGRSLVVKVASLDMVKSFKNEMVEMGLSEGVVRYLGGMQFLVTFNNAEHALMAKDELVGRDDFVVHVEVWEGQHVGFERIAWVRFRGLPL